MRIDAIRKGEAQITVSADELVWLHNLVYCYGKTCAPDPGASRPDAVFHDLARNIEIAKSLSQYGNLNGTALKHVVRHELDARPEGEIAKMLRGLCDAARETAPAPDPDQC